MRKTHDLSGQRFTRLIAVAKTNSVGVSMWRCTCDCGRETLVRASNLLSGQVRSCGCLRVDSGKSNFKHGMKKTKIYVIWHGIKARTGNPKCRLYKWYGAKGISMHQPWRDSFLQFLADVGEPPFEGATVDRIRNDCGYEPGNVRWATMREQNNNKSTNTRLTVDGRTQTLSQWSEETGLPSHTISARIHQLGWDADKAIKTPLRAKRLEQIQAYATAELGVEFE